MTINRREWMRQAGALAAASSAVRGAEGGSRPGWAERPMRWVQLAFVEDDPGRYDPRFWLDYFRRIHAEGVCLSAGGCVAFYPTRIPLHYRSKFLAGRDAFGETLAGCRGLGMSAIARIDPHAVHQDVYDAHPDWIAAEPDGRPRKHWAMPGLWVTCAFGPYYSEFMTGVIREIVTMYKVDGVFGNRWNGSGMCYCERCRREFRQASGLDLPQPAGASEEARVQYAAWRKQRLLALYKLWDAEVKKGDPEGAFLPNGYDEIRESVHAPLLVYDRQARAANAPAWLNGKFAKEARSIFGLGPAAGMFGVGLEEPYRWKDSVQHPAEIRAWATGGVAQGFRPWVIKFNAKPLDRRWFQPVEDLFVWHWKNEKYMRNERTLARAALVRAPRSAADHEFGFYHALVEGRIPFELLADLADLERFRVLALPNIVNLSDAECAQLKRFVENGGGLVATHETSLGDERGRRRTDFGLADLFGASFAGNVIERQQNAYLNLEDKTHPLLKGLEAAGRMIHGVKRVEIRAPAGLRAPLMTVPTYPDLPMEEVYLRDAATDIPGVMVRNVGRGRVVYFPWDIDRTFWEVLNADHGAVLANAVRWAANEEQPLQVEGPGLLDLALWRQRSSLTAHLVNLSNPMLMKGAYREVLPVGPQKVRLKLPEGAKPRGVRFLVSEVKAEWKESGGWIETATPPIALHEVVAVDLA